MQTENWFINSSVHIHRRIDGYWEPHSSSIDFCETNYLLSSHVVEPHNAWSSLWGISLFGVIGMFVGNPTGETRFKIAYGVLVFIGLGSAALHGTLHWFFQSSDELPMIYLVISALYCCLENNMQKPRYTWLPHLLVVVGVVNTCIYFRFQKIYIVFLFNFVSLTAIASVLHIKIALQQRQILLSAGSSKESSYSFTQQSNARIALRFYKWHYLLYLGIASPVWVLDQLWCDMLQPVYRALPNVLKGCTFHVVWHATAGFGAYTILQFLAVCRMSVLARPCRIRWIFGFLPVVVNGHEVGKKAL